MTTASTSAAARTPLSVSVAQYSAKEALTSPALLQSCEWVMRQLAPSLPITSGAYLSQVQRAFAAQPLTLIVASSTTDSAVVGVAVVRIYENTFNGTKLHIEGMCTDAAYRSRGVGRAMMNAVKSLGAQVGAVSVVCQVDSQNPAAQRFFARERLSINCLAFTGPATKPVRGDPSVSPASPVAAQAHSATAAATSIPAVSAVPVLSTPGFNVLELSDDATRTIPSHSLALLVAAERVHRQLRLYLAEGTDAYVARMKVVVAGGARMLVAVAEANSASDAPVVLGVCVHRFYKDLARGGARRVWVDDLVTDSAQRSQGVGAALVATVRAQAQAMGIPDIGLDSGVQRFQAHKFYFREAMIVDAFSYGGPLDRLPAVA